MILDPVRAYLLFGLLLHKAVWEILKRRDFRQTQAVKATASLTLVRVLKVAILVAILFQTVLPVILPLSQDSTVIRPVGVAIITLGLLIAVMARVQLGRQWSDIEVGSVAKDHVLIDRGIY